METTFIIWRGSGFRVMPQPGGLDDQDPHWVADMALCMRLKAFQEQAQQAYNDDLSEDLKRRNHVRRRNQRTRT